VKIVGRDAVAEANVPVLGLELVGTSTAVHGGVPHVEKVIVPDGPTPMLWVTTVAVKVTVCPVFAVAGLATSVAAVAACETAMTSVTGVVTGL
jgi:hypothetical protein